MSLTPQFTTYDPRAEGEGSLDPLGLEASAERLAEQLLPGMTARMHRIRALTVLSVGAHVCQPHMDEYTRDQTTPAWLVFEWMYVEALAQGSVEATNIPGVQTARTVLRGGGHLSGPVYLKSPVALGLHGFFRTLARAVRVLEDSGYLGENGDVLLRAWERDRSLDGFLDGLGPGGKLLDNFRYYLERSLEAGRIAAGERTDCMVALRTQLTPSPGPESVGERRALRRILDEDERRRETLEILARGLETEAFQGEIEMARWVERHGSHELSAGARALIAYERLAVLLTEAFELVCWRSSRNRGKPLQADELTTERHADLHAQLPAAIEANRRAEDDIEHDAERSQVLTWFTDVRTPADFVARLLDRHREVQRRKGQEGKRPWFERTEGGDVVRSGYIRHAQPQPRNGFMHPARLANARDFLTELTS